MVDFLAQIPRTTIVSVRDVGDQDLIGTARATVQALIIKTTVLIVVANMLALQPWLDPTVR